MHSSRQSLKNGLDSLTNEQLGALERRLTYRKAWFSFWAYCKLMAPDFYTEDRAFLKNVCDTLQSFYESEDKILVMCMPPRHGKSRTASLFTEWVFGHDPGAHVITASYNEELSSTFAKTVRNAIQEIKATPEVPVYSDVFPDTKIKPGSGSMKLWGIEGGRGEHSYLATSPGGTVTGFGANLLIIDDLVKNAEEAYNERRLGQLWDYFANTLMSRREQGFKIVVIMTRWATGDLAGRALDHFERIGVPVRQVLYRAKQDDGSMLCPDILNADDYAILLSTQDKSIVMANYQQEPIDIRGRLYSGFRTYSEVPALSRVLAYCDTADQGTDYLCSIVFGQLAESPQDVAILSVIYTEAPMETTEPMVAHQYAQEYGGLPVSAAQIESNNGGRGFARAVAEILRRERSTATVGWFTQTANKRARILTAAPWLCAHVLMPEHWADLWPEWWHHIATFTADGHAEHDDAEDALSGVCELMTKPRTRKATIRAKPDARKFANPTF